MNTTFIKQIALMGLLACALLDGEAIATDGNKEKETIISAETWLTLVDDGNYAEGWKGTAESLRAETDQKQWELRVRRRRESLGAVISRKVTITGVWSSDPGAISGEYSFVRFKTSFSAGKSATETVTAALEKDDRWRVTHYLITTPWPARRRILKALLLLLVIIWVWYRELSPRYA